jgi:single-strand DNA-binding protein
MAEIITNPELRYTADNQMAIANTIVQFAPPPGSRPDDQHPTIEVVGWGNLATEIKENYQQGDRVTIEGRLEMNPFEQDGVKGKRAKLVANRIYRITVEDTPATAATATATSVPAPASATPRAATTAKPAAKVEAPPLANDVDTDEIPF